MLPIGAHPQRVEPAFSATMGALAAATSEKLQLEAAGNFVTRVFRECSASAVTLWCRSWSNWWQLHATLSLQSLFE